MGFIEDPFQLVLGNISPGIIRPGPEADVSLTSVMEPYIHSPIYPHSAHKNFILL